MDFVRQAGSVLTSVVLGCLVALAGSSALAQKTTFEPSIELGQGYTDNVGFTATDPQSDDITVFTLQYHGTGGTKARTTTNTQYHPSFVVTSVSMNDNDE